MLNAILTCVCVFVAVTGAGGAGSGKTCSVPAVCYTAGKWTDERIDLDRTPVQERLEELAKKQKEQDEKIAILTEENNKIRTDTTALEKRLDAKTTECDTRLDKLEAAYNEKTSLLKYIAKENNFCKYTYKSSCFFGKFPSKTARNTNDSAAKELCAAYGAKPANVYSEENYNQLGNYMRSEIGSGQGYIAAWLGMTADPEVPSYSLSTGQPAPYLHWYRAGSDRYPKTGPSEAGRTGMSIHIGRNPYAANQGMFNYVPANGNHGVICEIYFGQI